MVAAEATVVSAGVDWLTCTAEGQKGAAPLANLAINLLRKEMKRGNLKHGWGMAGYSGFRSGSIQTGQREESLIVRLSSHVAHEHWRRAYELADNVSRLDLQVTVRDASDPHSLIHQHDRQARKYAASKRRKNTVSLFSANDGSSTLYLGKRVSDRYGRIYDKGLESKLPEFKGCVRYEVEYKNELATEMATRMYQGKDDQGLAAWYVTTMMKERGCRSQFLTNAADESGMPRIPMEIPGDKPEARQTRTDARRRLDWLETAVRPSVEFLLSLGLERELLEALGVSIVRGRLSLKQKQSDDK